MLIISWFTLSLYPPLSRVAVVMRDTVLTSVIDSNPNSSPSKNASKPPNRAPRAACPLALTPPAWATPRLGTNSVALPSLCAAEEEVLAETAQVRRRLWCRLSLDCRLYKVVRAGTGVGSGGVGFSIRGLRLGLS